MTVETHAFQSSNLKSARYDTETRTLTMTFNSGKTHPYTGVPLEKWEGLKQASSAGSYFHAQIRSGGYG